MANHSPEFDPTDTRVAVIGAGLIGCSWAALFLAKGARVAIYDPRTSYQNAARQVISEAWPSLLTLGLAFGGVPWDKLTFSDYVVDACRDAAFVQENGPDRIDIKRNIIAEIEQALPSGAVIASSTSSLLPTDLQEAAQEPGRILVAHPMNPPHLVPMVELVAGKSTSEETVRVATAFYEAMDRVVIKVRKEVIGHLANRLTSALYREAVHLVAEGIGTVEDVDKAVAYGPGMRWALMGPHLIYHLGGGIGGYKSYLDHLGSTQEARWQELGAPTLDEETRSALVAGLEEELSVMDQASLRQRRDDALVALNKLKSQYQF